MSQLEDFRKYCDEREFTPNEYQWEIARNVLDNDNDKANFRLVHSAKLMGKTTIIMHLKEFLEAKW